MIRIICFLFCFFVSLATINALALNEKEEYSDKLYAPQAKKYIDKSQKKIQERTNREEASQIKDLKTTDLEYNLGGVEKDKITKKIIKIRNGLDEAIEIREARSACECVKANTKPQIVDKGDIFEIEITLDTTGISQEQDIEKVVYILTKNMKYELIRLVISAKIQDTGIVESESVEKPFQHSHPERQRGILK